MLVTEIRVEGEQLRVTGSNAALAHAVAQAKVDTREMPTFAPDWLPERNESGHWTQRVVFEVKHPDALAGTSARYKKR